jgi:hypothetical protein
MVKAFKAYAQTHQIGYGEDSWYGEMALVFPGIEVKVPFTEWHFATASVGGKISLSKNVRKFGEQYDGSFGANDIGLRKITELPQEEWSHYMQYEAGLSNREYGYVAVEASDALVEMLKQKTISKETNHDAEIDTGLVKILLTPTNQQ